ncbi:hypothetical protein HHL27_10230 [Novosphingobium sp. TW-4]|uniref:Phytoene synthase n=2 Tax=Novosphingobium olei TaxID=2728851 RepID=A0A7Y0G9I2_9SPHN|nr:hypothetical protein [Novosphingobium olei]
MSHMQAIENQDKALDDVQLDPVERLAVAYAPAGLRALWIGFLAFDHRLADAAREGRDPIMVQLRLAWWRDRMGEPVSRWPQGEPLLAVLAPWDAERAALGAIVDGWEARNVGSDGGVALRAARIGALAAIARLGGARDGAVLAAVAQAGGEWLDRKAAANATPRLPRSMRPLAVLRAAALAADDTRPMLRFGTLLRVGLFGR